MKFLTRSAGLLACLVGANLLTIQAPLAHSFKLVLLLPANPGAADDGRSMRLGFMLATTERDSHADEESDGHLGGLDVYVTVLDGGGDNVAKLARLAASGGIDVVAALGSKPTPASLIQWLGQQNIALLRPGQLPGKAAFVRSRLPAVLAFAAAYQSKFGAPPGRAAGQGYNAARRIGHAVRAQGGVADRNALQQSFKITAKNFNW